MAGQRITAMAPNHAHGPPLPSSFRCAALSETLHQTNSTYIEFTEAAASRIHLYSKMFIYNTKKMILYQQFLTKFSSLWRGGE
jgi:hypothetical protein